MKIFKKVTMYVCLDSDCDIDEKTKVEINAMSDRFNENPAETLSTELETEICFDLDNMVNDKKNYKYSARWDIDDITDDDKDSLAYQEVCEAKEYDGCTRP